VDRVAELLGRLTTALADRYRIEREIGAGGMATVYLAQDLKHDRKVAIKVLRPELGASLGPERFLQEIKLAAKLQHPHIVGLIDSGVITDGLGGETLSYYVMPFVEGETLRERLARSGRLPVPEVVRLTGEIADALAKAHRAGVVHRDIKPANILLADGHALVTDFGVAKAVSAATGRQGLTSAGVSLGTPAYMAPEQVAADSLIDHRADLYALGLVAYEMLVGASPYTATTPQQQMLAHITQTPRPIYLQRPDCPPALAALVMRCLSKNPDERWQSAEEVLTALASIETITPRRESWWTRRRLAAVVGAILLLVGVMLGVRHPVGAPSDGASSDVLAVLPFTVRGSPALDYLREGLVALLNASLDGAVGIRSVNAHALLAFVGPGRSAISLDRARRVAEHFQAGLFVVGDVLDVQGKLRLSASLFDRAHGDRPLAEATVDGDPGDVLAMVDLLATRLAADRSAEGGARLTRTAAVTTSSLPALKAYLAGEQDYRAGQYAAAVSAFQEATAADTGFALAFYRLGMAQERLAWADESRRSAELAFRHSSRLSVHDRRFLEAVLAMRRARSADAEQQFRAIVQVYPDDGEAWYQLGELRFHGSPLHGLSMTGAREPFSRALFFDPGDLGALYHLVRIAARNGNRSELDSLATRFFQLSPAGDRTLELRALQAYTTHDSAGADSVVAQLGRAPDEVVPLAVWSIAVFAQNVPGAERIARLLTQPERPRDVRAQGHLMLAHLELARGRRSAAWSELGAAGKLSNSETPLVDAWFRLLPFVPQSRDQLAATRSRLARWDAGEVATRSKQASAFYSGHNGVHQILKTYLLGLLDTRLGDSARAMVRAAELDSSGRATEGPPLALELAHGLRAQVALAKGQPDSGLAALEADRIEGWYELTFVSPFYSGAMERFTRAELLRQKGRGEEALGWYHGLGENTMQELVFLGPATLAEARIQRALGRPKEAVRLYDDFLSLWRESDPDFKPMLDSAAAERAALVDRSVTTSGSGGASLAGDDALGELDERPYTAVVFHFPRLNTAALAIASSENDAMMAQNTPDGPSPIAWASHQANGISNTQKQTRLSHVGVHVSPEPLNDWVSTMP
jgi:tRNA A-37 threonylcarbamoyl transferase component Bud32/TolB-like protein